MHSEGEVGPVCCLPTRKINQRGTGQRDSPDRLQCGAGACRLIFPGGRVDRKDSMVQHVRGVSAPPRRSERGLCSGGEDPARH